MFNPKDDDLKEFKDADRAARKAEAKDNAEIAAAYKELRRETRHCCGGTPPHNNFCKLSQKRAPRRRRDERGRVEREGGWCV